MVKIMVCSKGGEGGEGERRQMNGRWICKAKQGQQWRGVLVFFFFYFFFFFFFFFFLFFFFFYKCMWGLVLLYELA